MNPSLSPFLGWLLHALWQASILTVIVLAAQWIFQKKLTCRWRHALWFLVLARLALPSSPSSPISFFNYARLEKVVARAPSKAIAPKLFQIPWTAASQSGGQNIERRRHVEIPEIRPSLRLRLAPPSPKRTGFRENAPNLCALVWRQACCFSRCESSAKFPVPPPPWHAPAGD